MSDDKVRGPGLFPEDPVEPGETGPPYSYTRPSAFLEMDAGRALERSRMQREGDELKWSPGEVDADDLAADIETYASDSESAEELLSTSDAMLLEDLGPRWATTSKLRTIVREGQKRGFNRTAEIDDLHLAADGKHVLVPLLVHRFIDGKPAEPHIRARVMTWTVERQPRELVLDVAEKSLRRLPRVEKKVKQSKPDPTWEHVVQMYVELYEQTRSRPALVDFEYQGVKADNYPLPASWIADLSPWYVTEDMLTLIDAAAQEKSGISPHPLRLDELVTQTGFLVLEHPMYFDLPTFGEVPIRAFSWKPETIEGELNLHVMSWIDMEHEDAPRDIDTQGYRARLWPGLHWWWPVGERVDAVLEWKNATEEAIDTFFQMRRWLMATWLISDQRVALVSGQKPARALRRPAERLRLPSKVLVVTLRRVAPRRYDEGDPRQVDWSHRWIVTGHWRHLSGDRITWVSPFVKGPPDKPLIIKDRIYKLER